MDTTCTKCNGTRQIKLFSSTVPCECLDSPRGDLPDITASLILVLDYLDEEEEDYETNVKAGRDVSLHVYTHVKVLKDYLEKLP